MCKNRLCGVQDLQPLLERMVGTEDHDLREARMMLTLPSDNLDFWVCMPCLLPSRRVVNGGWYENVPLHASFDHARVADARG